MAAVTVDHRPVLPLSSRDGAQPSGPRRRSPGPPVGRRPARHAGSAAARRSAVVGGFAAVLVACAVWVQAGAGRAGSGPLAAPGAGRTQAVAARVWAVQPGDTLWGIARQLQPHGDVRPLVDALSREVRGQPLQVGEELQLP